MTLRLGPAPTVATTPGRVVLRQMGLLPTLVVGLIVALLFFGGFGAWAAFAPLDSAAIAQGTLSVQSRRKAIQHLEGGIVGELLVDEGSVVEAGEVLLRIDATQAQIRYDLYSGRLYAAQAQVARLRAERDGTEDIRFPDHLIAAAADDPDVAQILAGQRNIFVARRESMAKQKAILEQRILQLEEEVTGLEAQIETQNRRLGYINDELSGVQKLYDQGLALRPRLLGLQANAQAVIGERAEARALIARAQQRIGETQIEIDNLGTSMINEVVEQLRTAEAQVEDLNEQVASARDILNHTDVVAPVAGTVVNMQSVNVGGVVGPGQLLMELVPADDNLIIEARVQPNDIDVVQPGQEAQVRFSAFSARRTPSFDGEVLQVSADRLVDERSGETYYVARIGLEENQRGFDEIELYPGMQAEVLIKTGERTPLNYLLTPLSNSLNRALREK